MKRLLTAATLATIFANSAYALGVTAGTNITNTATLSYSAGGVSQPSVTSNEDSFVVDKKIDMVLTTDDTDQIVVTPGQTDRITSYTFKNEGNSVQKFKFEVANLANNAEADYNDKKDNENANNLRVQYSTDNGSSWTDLPSDGIVEVNEDTIVKFRVKADIPQPDNTPATNDAGKGDDNDVMNIELKSTAYKADGSAAEEQTSGDDTQNQVDIVFADGTAVANGASTNGGQLGATGNGKGDTAKDGKEVARSGYIIHTPVLSATKTSCVVSDPVNGTTHPKRIPGAVIRYMFDINNTGSANVSDLNITDTLNSNLDLTNTASSAKKTESQDAACVCATAGSSDISSDATVSGQDLTIEHLNTQSGKHTCVSIETEIK